MSSYVIVPCHDAYKEYINWGINIVQFDFFSYLLKAPLYMLSQWFPNCLPRVPRLVYQRCRKTFKYFQLNDSAFVVCQTIHVLMWWCCCKPTGVWMLPLFSLLRAWGGAEGDYRVFLLHTYISVHLGSCAMLDELVFYPLAFVNWTPVFGRNRQWQFFSFGKFLRSIVWCSFVFSVGIGNGEGLWRWMASTF